MAKVVGPKPAHIVISSKENFIDIINQDDVKNLRKAVKEYSDFQKEGMSLINEMELHKHVM